VKTAQKSGAQGFLMRTPVLFSFKRRRINWKKARIPAMTVSSARAVPTPPTALSAGGRTGTVSGRRQERFLESRKISGRNPGRLLKLLITYMPNTNYLKEKSKMTKKSIIALLLCLAALFSLCPAAMANQYSDYHDPAENWYTSSNRTKELDVNAVMTHETFYCVFCDKDT